MAEDFEISNEDYTAFITEASSLLNVDFKDYAPQSLKRRLQHLLTLYSLKNIDALLLKLSKDEQIREKCINDITVNTTEMFRDQDIWKKLKNLFADRFQNASSINIWHAGCSTGEEVYSMLILLNEYGLLDRAKIFGTDINTYALQKSKEGKFEKRFLPQFEESYNQIINEDGVTSNNNFSDYYDLVDKKSQFQFKSFLREKVIFRINNLADSDVFYKFDLILCRNVIIYFNSELQNKVISLFHNSLLDDGLILIGAHESIGYIPIASKFRNISMRGLYVKKANEY